MSPIYCVKFHCLILIVLQLGMGVCCMPSLKANVYRVSLRLNILYNIILICFNKLVVMDTFRDSV